MKTEALFYKGLRDGSVACHLCAHHCRIAPGEVGFCGVRKNESGVLYTSAYGETIARNIDPIEKKPLYHFIPGTLSYSIATAGCNFRCGFCQNWQISQSPREHGRTGNGRPFYPENVANEASARGCASISYTYTEPTIFFEYARETALCAARRGIKNGFVTNGYITRRALDDAASWLDAANVDLKAWRNEDYRRTCKARIRPVLDAIRYMKRLGIWVEVTTLVIPGYNDGDADLEGIADFIGCTGPEIPWHISRFHPDYQFGSHPPTPSETLQRAEEIGRKAGLLYIYPGNVGHRSDTRCPDCGEALIIRSQAGVRQRISDGGLCPACGRPLEGIW
jgi:pyruvate formate lyase activating enzyme